MRERLVRLFVQVISGWSKTEKGVGSPGYRERDFSSVSLGLLRGVVVLFLAAVDEFDCIGVLPTRHGSLTLLVGDKGLNFLNIVEFAVGEPKMVPLVETSPDGRNGVRRCQVDELGHVENVEEFGAVPHVEPHPVTVGLQTDGLESE